MNRFTDLPMDKLQEIFEVIKCERPKLIQSLIDDRFEGLDEKSRAIGGMTFFIGSDILKLENPLAPKAADISFDIYYFIIRNQGDLQ